VDLYPDPDPHQNVMDPEHCYQEALQLDPEDGSALCSLARLYLMNDDLDQCQYTCMTLLRYLTFRYTVKKGY
jgi:hypothetical protein